jgi:hypothetical protein
MDTVQQLPDPDAIPDAEVKPEDAGEYKTLSPAGSDVLVVQLLDEKAAGYFGRYKMPNETRWCTRRYGEDGNMYSYYAKKGPIFVIVPKVPEHTGERYQFHFETKQYMDEHDRQIGPQGMAKLVARYPVLKEVFKTQAEKFIISALLSDEYKNIVKEFTPEAMKRTNQLVLEYKDRIIGFGFKLIGEYGIHLEGEQQHAIAQAMQPYVDQVLGAMKVGFWPTLSESLGTERSEEKAEALFASDPTISDLARSSPPAKMLTAALQQSGQKLHKDAIPHIIDLLVKDPIGRFIMRQVPKMYTAKLQENGHAL